MNALLATKVLRPAKDRPTLLREVTDSVAAGRVRAWEHIVVHDGSCRNVGWRAAQADLVAERPSDRRAEAAS